MEGIREYQKWKPTSFPLLFLQKVLLLKKIDSSVSLGEDVQHRLATSPRSLLPRQTHSAHSQCQTVAFIEWVR
jgi:hypothetical protein